MASKCRLCRSDARRRRGRTAPKLRAVTGRCESCNGAICNHHSWRDDGKVWCTECGHASRREEAQRIQGLNPA